ncbi:YqiA/YcfP family alpha/beta fold hydrolase [Marinimicrobium alkaliphilum]|uniref:YqiA/YcfP family alpha/beta fold hydrolase n=1 Tax=Marinimicrobium alkaliphilum TaxID=2202654 RepID=UPI000DBA61B8|nr:YqiA/YcfP family alpha/beta fold hydrolase [Marinimicrobium alkaliphilum]
MTSLVYIHGFLSSPGSYKAQATARWLKAHRPDIGFFCPHLTPYPRQTQLYLENLVESLQAAGPVVLMGSSLGGYWCTWLAERYDLKAVLINPSVKPWAFMPEYLEVDLKGYHTDDSYRLHAHHVDEIKAVYVDALTRKDNYWLLAQTGDETLDYREAVARYQGCKQTIEEGGDHSFQNFDRHLPELIAFLVARDR